jgi:hypothetical protein
MANVGIFLDHLEYFRAIWSNFWPFGIVCCQLLYFFQFGMFGPRKIWQPCIYVRAEAIKINCSFHERFFVKAMRAGLPDGIFSNQEFQFG